MNRSLLKGAAVAFAFALGIGEVPAQQRTTTPEGQRQTQPGQPSQTQPGQSQPGQTQTRPGQTSQTATQTGPVTVQSFVQQIGQWNDGEVELARLAMTRGQSDDVKDYAEDLISDSTEANDKLREYAMENGITLRVTHTSDSSRSDSSSSTSTTRTPQGSELTPDRAPQRSETGQPGRGTSSTTPQTGQAGRSDTGAAGGQTSQPGQPGQQGQAGRTAPSTSQTPSTASTASQQPSPQEQVRELTAKSATEFDRAFLTMMIDNHQRAQSMIERQVQAKLGDEELQDFMEDHLDMVKDHLEKAQEIQKDLLSKGAGSAR